MKRKDKNIRVQPTFSRREQLQNALYAVREYEQHEYHLPMPVHLIWGEYDELIPPERGKLFQEHLNGNATLDIIKDGGHMPNMNKKRVFNRLLKKYVVD